MPRWSIFDQNMRFQISFVLLLICSSCLLSESEVVGAPLCDVCECVEHDAMQNVICKQVNKIYIFNESLWQHENNTMFGNVSLHMANLTDLDRVFPASTLKRLDLSRNSIKRIGNNTFKNLQEMQCLILSSNNIEDLDPNVFQGIYLDGDFMPLRSLKILNLDHNQIHTLNQDVFEHTSRLEELDLSYNPLKAMDKSTIIAITTLAKIKVLDLSYTQLATLPIDLMHTPYWLETLYLTGNNFVAIPETLSQSHNLNKLSFSDNPITNLTEMNGFPLIPTLKILFMTNMRQLTSIGKGSFSKLPILEELYITDNTHLHSVDVAALTSRNNESGFESWPPIKKLYLENNNLTSLDMHFVQWEDLQEMDISNNIFGCECGNQWMLDELLPIYLRINKPKATQLKCASPPEMETFTFLDLHSKGTSMRCADFYGNRPEKDGLLLVGILCGVLVATPVAMVILYILKERFFATKGNSAIYSQASIADDGYL